jgi:hypothetical protein
MGDPPLAQLTHHRRFLPREISIKPSFEVTFAPSGLEVLFSLRSIAPIQTTFPIHKFKRQPQSRGRDKTCVMRLEPLGNIARQANIKLLVS